MPEFIPILTKDEINASVVRIAEKVSSDYEGKEVVLVGVLKGAFIFLADLVRYLTIPIQLDFIRPSSYGSETSSSGVIRLLKDIEIDIKLKHVLIVEDIVDTGLTLHYLQAYLKARGALSVKVCAFVDKKERRKISVPIAYACHVADEGFLVGYGLDYAENYRELPGLYHLKL